MPAFDYPLDKLKEYKGVTPKPNDFDAYWERARAELDSTPADPEFVANTELPVNSVHCQDLYYTGVRGARIHAKFIKPAHPPSPHPVVFFFHGYRNASPAWFDLLNWTAAGFAVVAMDCRGQGGLSEDPGGVQGYTAFGHIIRGLYEHEDQLLFRHIFLDTAQLVRVIAQRDDIDPQCLFTLGTSQGGGLALACAALEPRISRAAAINPFLSDYRRVWEMDLASGSYDELAAFFILFDPRHEQEEKYWGRLGYISIHNLAPAIRCRTLMQTGLMDKTCPPSTQFAAYNNLSGPKEMVLYPDFGHIELPGATTNVLNFFKR